MVIGPSNRVKPPASTRDRTGHPIGERSAEAHVSHPRLCRVAEPVRDLGSATAAHHGLRGPRIAEFLGDYSVVVNWFGAVAPISLTVTAFLVVTLGLLLVPAITLKGSLNLSHDGVTFERGKQHLTASWEQVTGLVYRRDAGLCLTMEGAQQTTPRMRLAGGFDAVAGAVRIPLRMFGDRQFSILYDIRERLPEASWLPAVQKVRERSPRMNLAIYAAVVLISAGAIIAVAMAIPR